MQKYGRHVDILQVLCWLLGIGG